MKPQHGICLGQRMSHALSDGLTRADAVVLIGSDCLGYTPEYMRQAFDQLRRHPVVLGPSTDGGYVLIGVRRWHPALFRHIAWGTERVLAETRARLSELQWPWAELAPLTDIDTVENWRSDWDGAFD